MLPRDFRLDQGVVLGFDGPQVLLHFVGIHHSEWGFLRHDYNSSRHDPGSEEGENPFPMRPRPLPFIVGRARDKALLDPVSVVAPETYRFCGRKDRLE
jgi:hypothetical protein